MRITVNRLRFLDAMRRVAAWIPNVPRVSNVVKDDKPKPLAAPAKMAKLTVTDKTLDIFGGTKEGFGSIQIDSMAGQFTEDGVCLAPHGCLVEILGACRGHEVVLSGDAAGIQISSQGSKFTISSADPDLFPMQLPSGMRPIGSVPSNQLRRAIRQASFATARKEDDPRFLMTVVSFEIGKDLTLVATDTRNLSVSRVFTINREGFGDCILESRLAVPVDCVTDLLPLLADDDKPVMIGATEGIVGFHLTCDGAPVSFYSALASGKFPPWRSVMPKPDGLIKYHVPAGQLAAAARLMEPFCELGILVTCRDGAWRFSGERSQVGKGWIEVDAAGVGDHVIRLPAKKLEQFADVASLETDAMVRAFIPDDDSRPILFELGDWRFLMNQCVTTLDPKAQTPEPAMAGP